MKDSHISYFYKIQACISVLFRYIQKDEIHINNLNKVQQGLVMFTIITITNLFSKNKKIDHYTQESYSIFSSRLFSLFSSNLFQVLAVFNCQIWKCQEKGEASGF